MIHPSSTHKPSPRDFIPLFCAGYPIASPIIQPSFAHHLPIIHPSFAHHSPINFAINAQSTQSTQSMPQSTPQAGQASQDWVGYRLWG